MSGTRLLYGPAAERRAAAIARLRERHRRVDLGGVVCCAVDGELWPCDVALALRVDGDEGEARR